MSRRTRRSQIDEELIYSFLEEERRYPKRERKSVKMLDTIYIEDEQTSPINKAETLMSHKSYDMDLIINSAKFNHPELVKEMSVKDFTIDYIRESGLIEPVLFNDPASELGMRMPQPDSFSVRDVLDNVGDRRIEVVEVSEQRGRSMKLQEFINYYLQGPNERKELLNVLSLEFTSTALSEIISAPEFVPKIDWIDQIWPKNLFKRQEILEQLIRETESSQEAISTYPKVQRYCLMSVKGCFTDFHIDFGGTSVWYHILKGEKIFWIIPASENNIRAYEDWILGGSTSSRFFGSVVPVCHRVHLYAGQTLIIPSGWIHCVYTPVDSLVFGGNFLHSFSIPMQLRVWQSEDKTKIGAKYRFPHFKQIFWCYAAEVVRRATNRCYQAPIKVARFEAQLRELLEQRQKQMDDAIQSVINTGRGMTINNAGDMSKCFVMVNGDLKYPRDDPIEDQKLPENRKEARAISISSDEKITNQADDFTYSMRTPPVIFYRHSASPPLSQKPSTPSTLEKPNQKVNALAPPSTPPIPQRFLKSKISKYGIEDSDNEEEENDDYDNRFEDFDDSFEEPSTSGSKYNENGEEICYDEFGNDVDQNYSPNPVQESFGRQNVNTFSAALHYNEDYVKSLSPFEVNGILTTVPFLMKLLRSRYPEVAEGVTRPEHLVLELQARCFLCLYLLYF